MLYRSDSDVYSTKDDIDSSMAERSHEPSSSHMDVLRLHEDIRTFTPTST